MLAGVIFLAQPLNGQDETDAGFDSPTSSTNITKSSSYRITDSNGATTLTYSNADGPMVAPPFFSSGRSSIPAPDAWNMIGNPSVQMDLNLVDDQKQKIVNLKKDMAKEAKRLVGQLRNGNPRPDLIDQLKSTQSDYKKKMMDLLLPNQQDRLKQIALQMHMKNSGASTAITNRVVAEALGMTPEQTKNLKAKSEELNKKLGEEIEELKVRMKNELLAELTPAQREILKELKGDAYTPQPSDWIERSKQFRSFATPERN